LRRSEIELPFSTLMVQADLGNATSGLGQVVDLILKI